MGHKTKQKIKRLEQKLIIMEIECLFPKVKYSTPETRKKTEDEIRKLMNDHDLDYTGGCGVFAERNKNNKIIFKY
jgi:hypothetical protein